MSPNAALGQGRVEDVEEDGCRCTLCPYYFPRRSSSCTRGRRRCCSSRLGKGRRSAAAGSADLKRMDEQAVPLKDDRPTRLGRIGSRTTLALADDAAATFLVVRTTPEPSNYVSIMPPEGARRERAVFRPTHSQHSGVDVVVADEAARIGPRSSRRCRHVVRLI